MAFNPDQDFLNASDELKKLETALNNQSNMQKAAEAELQKLRCDNVRAVVALEIAERNKVQATRLRAETEITSKRKTNLEAEIKLEISKINQVQAAALQAENELTNKRQAAIDATTSLLIAQKNRLKGIESEIETAITKARLKHEEEVRQARIKNLTAYQEREEAIKTKADVKAIQRGYYAAGDADALKKQKEAEYNSPQMRGKMLAEGTNRIKAEEKQHGRKLTADEKKAIRDKVKAENDEKLKLELKNIDKKEAKSAKARARYEKQETTALNKAAGKELAGQILSADTNLVQKLDILRSGIKPGKDKDGKDVLRLDEAFAALANISQQLGKKADEIAVKKSTVDTRLQGSKNAKNWGGSYWEQMLQDATAVAGISPFIKQSALTNNIEQFVSKGIAFDVEQRAFLQTISDKIANTFDATDSALLRLVKIQQQDTTASRLGMESALTAFLNNMYETTEYMSTLAASVRQNLVEAQSLMSGAAGVELEYQVQKWMGSMSSVGMSDGAVQALSQTLGDLAAGKVDAITKGGAGNLLVMAANQAGLSISDILAKGLDANSTNQLMQAMVNYMAGMYNEAGGASNKVVAQQLANVFGVSASDLKAATNLSSSISSITNNNLTNKGMLNQLQSMYNTMYQRTSMGEMVSNVKDNFLYTMASSMASNPALYFLNTAAGLLDSFGGIALPDIKVMGSGVNLQTTVADLMRVGALGGSALQGIGSMIGGLSKGGLNGLKIMGVDMSGNGNYVTRGSGEALRTETSGFSTTESGSYAGNSDTGDIQAATLNSANDDANAQYVEAQESEDADTKNKVIDEHIVQIYQLLEQVVNGTQSIKVAPENSMAWSGIFMNP